MSTRRKLKKHLIRHRYMLLALALLLAVGGSTWVLTSNGNKDSKVDITSDGSYMNLNPPTEEEKQETAAHKKDLANQSQNPPPTTASGKLQVTPVITSVSQTEVRGFVQGVVEDSGTCTVTLTKGSTTLTESSQAFANASYTSCQPIDLGGMIGPGNWNVTLAYSSPKAEGKSQPKSYSL